MSRRRLTDQGVSNLKPRAARYAMPDPELVGHYVMVQPTGVKTFKAVARDPFGKQVWATLGRADHVKIEAARELAREAIRRIRAGKVAVEPPAPAPDSFATVSANWFKRHVEAKALRTRDEIERCLRVYVLPHWGARPFAEIKRRDLAQLLDHVEDHHGARMADAVLATVSSLMRWQAARSDDYVVPVAPGMRRTSTKERARKRILDDAEIKIVWKAAEANGQLGAIIRLLVLTGQRLSKVVQMRWSDIAVDGTWTIATAPREKGNAGVLVLPEQAAAIIRQQPRIEGNPFVFAGRGMTHIGGFTKLKARFDATLPPEMPPWVMHDCRRTARSLLSRAGVRPDISERVLGHVQDGVEGVYDRHSYTVEKADALRRLAALIEGIVTSAPAGKVVPIRART